MPFQLGHICIYFGAGRRCRPPRPSMAAHGFQDRCQSRLASSSRYISHLHFAKFRKKHFDFAKREASRCVAPSEGLEPSQDFSPWLPRSKRARFRSGKMANWRRAEVSTPTTFNKGCASLSRRAPEPSGIARHLEVPDGIEPPLTGLQPAAFPTWLWNHDIFSNFPEKYLWNLTFFRLWNRLQDSNLPHLGQSQVCCRYTKPVCGAPGETRTHTPFDNGF